jgi:hypothetical protein
MEQSMCVWPARRISTREWSMNIISYPHHLDMRDLRQLPPWYVDTKSHLVHSSFFLPSTRTADISQKAFLKTICSALFRKLTTKVVWLVQNLTSYVRLNVATVKRMAPFQTQSSLSYVGVSWLGYKYVFAIDWAPSIIHSPPLTLGPKMLRGVIIAQSFQNHQVFLHVNSRSQKH